MSINNKDPKVPDAPGKENEQPYQPMSATKEELEFNAALIKKLTAEPEADPDVWKQVSDWLNKGMIGESVFRRTDPDSYKCLQEFDLVKRTIPENFRYWHVEDLLDQVAVLLDRAMANRAEWREKLTKAFYVESEILEYIEMEKVYAKEVRDGLYEVPYVEAEKERAAQYQYFYYNGKTSETSVESRLKHIYISLYNYWDQANNQIGKWRWDVEERSAGVRYYEMVALNAATELRLESATRRSDWEKVNRLYKKERADAARKTAEQKIAAFTTAGGALNYPEQMRKIKDLIARDAGDAFNRIKVAALGLTRIFGYTDPLPDSITLALETGKSDHHALDAAALWTRDAITWLVGFKQLDQNFVQPISLRSLITEDQWKIGKDALSWTATINAGPFFTAFSHVRLRGVRAFVYGAGIEPGFWRIELKPPAQATIKHGNEEKMRPLDQSSVPTITIPRAGSRSNTQEVEFVGAMTLFNTSPIGPWTLTITAKSTQRVPVSIIEDIELELVVAARSV